MEALKRYKFSLAFENSNEEDYVTEKFFQSLVAGMRFSPISPIDSVTYICRMRHRLQIRLACFRVPFRLHKVFPVLGVSAGQLAL